MKLQAMVPPPSPEVVARASAEHDAHTFELHAEPRDGHTLDVADVVGMVEPWHEAPAPAPTTTPTRLPGPMTGAELMRQAKERLAAVRAQLEDLQAEEQILAAMVPKED